MHFYHTGKPIAKQRHRTSNGRTYDPQYSEKMKMKWDFANQFRQESYLKATESPIACILDIRCPIPNSWSQKRRNEAEGKFVTTRPDCDNYEKFYLDVLNDIAYRDDSLVALNLSYKTYSSKAGVDISLISLEENMVNEHAITFKEKLSLEDLNYLIKKANKLGITGRCITRVYQEHDEEGSHVYFSVEGLKEKL